MPDIETKPAHETQLYGDVQSGRIVCFNHLGGYGTHAVRDNPNARQWITPLDVWEVVTADENNAWIREFKEPMKCEDCSYSPDW